MKVKFHFMNALNNTSYTVVKLNQFMVQLTIMITSLAITVLQQEHYDLHIIVVYTTFTHE